MYFLLLLILCLDTVRSVTPRIKRSIDAVYINILMRCEKYKPEPLAMLSYLLLKKVWPNKQRDKEVTNNKKRELLLSTHFLKSDDDGWRRQ